MALKTRLKGSTLLPHTMVGMVDILNTREGVKLAGMLGMDMISAHIQREAR